MKRLLIIATTLLAASAGVSAQEAAQENWFCSEKSFDHDLNYMIAPIKSKSELWKYLRNEDIARSPLGALSRESRKKFIESLRFSETGLASFRAVDLERELSPTQIYKVLALFGQQHDTPLLKNARIRTDLDREIIDRLGPRLKCTGDYDKKYCDPKRPHTCATSVSDICTSNC